MTREVFEDTVTQLLTHRPFQVFTVELQNGRVHEIDHPLAMSYRNGVAVFIAPAHVPIIFDHDNVVRIIAAPAAAANP